MFRPVFSATMLLIFAALAGCAASPKTYGDVAAQRIEFTSYTPTGLHNILDGSWQDAEQVRIYGNLYVPTSSGDHAAVVVHHGSDHVSNYQGWLADLVPRLTDRGIAVFVLDSYSARGISATYSDQSKLSKAARIVDALRALEVLGQRPDIDASRIGITGYSFGGLVSLYTAHAKIAESVAEGREFAAHLPVYPSCQAQFEDWTFTGAPIHILAGGADDWTPARYCERYVASLQKAGYRNASITVYSGAEHAFIDPGGKRRCASCWTFRECGVMRIDRQGYEHMGRYSSRQGWEQYVTAAAQQCGLQGTTLGGTPQQRRAALDDTVDFFDRTLKGGA